MKVALFGTTINPDAHHYIEVMLEALEKHSASYFVFSQIADSIRKLNPGSAFEGEWESHEDLIQIQPDYLITLGGDGTILKAVTKVLDANIPIVGINTGRLGFLANIARHESKTAIHDLVSGNFTISERRLLDVTVKNGDPLPLPFALNEITVARKDTTSMVTVHTWINDEFLSSYWADGLIIATATGSTGYSLSCGGPIIMPGSENFVITPISPHNLNVRPFVIPYQHSITIKIQSRETHFLTSLDSRIHSMPIDTELLIKKADFTIKMVQTEQQKFTKTLREKLFWGKDIRN
ncbi:MAG: NAD kinase [Cryomorphaceae bacterium]|nr:NAD kinase [Cryomorphaceae bacterium]